MPVVIAIIVVAVIGFVVWKAGSKTSSDITGDKAKELSENKKEYDNASWNDPDATNYVHEAAQTCPKTPWYDADLKDSTSGDSLKLGVININA